MRILKLISEVKTILPGLIVLSVVNSFLNLAVLWSISSALNASQAQIGFIIPSVFFLLIVIISLLCNLFFQSRLIVTSSRLRQEFELIVFARMKVMSWQDFERNGPSRFYRVFGDLTELDLLPGILMSVMNNAVIVLCCVGYLFWIDFFEAIIISILLGGIVTVYLLRNNIIELKLKTLRELHIKQFEYIRDLIEGFRDVKVDMERTNILFERFLVFNSREMHSKRVSTNKHYLANEVMGKYGWYFIIGVVIFVLPSTTFFHFRTTGSLIVTLLFMMGGIAGLISSLPRFLNARMTLSRVHEFNKTDDLSSKESHVVAPEKDFDSLIFKGVIYRREKLDSEFCFGPVDIEIKKGELVFITGGNGSGKTTFINLLTGLQMPVEGNVLINGTPVSIVGHSKYISAVFANPFMFSTNYNSFDISYDNTRLAYFAKLLKMSENLFFEDKTKKNSSMLSRGQQKRLALIYALMEEKPILILDEWASEQDPEFKFYFYRELLPLLIRLGKTIVAVTHDDIYFSQADRVIRFEYGRVKSDYLPNETV